MAEFGNFIIYIIMAGTLIGALASIVKPEGELGREFVNGIHAIGPVFLAQAGIMAAIPIISYLIMYSIGPFFSALGSDASIAALAVIAVDMGGYQLADAIAANRDMWIVAMLVGYTSGASIVYLIPVGLIMLNRDDHKYLALGAMAGLISIPFAVLIALVLVIAHKFVAAGRRPVAAVLPGIAVTLVLWFLAGLGFGFYLDRFSNAYASTYGGLATAMVFLVFLYWLAAMLLFGGEINGTVIAARRQQLQARMRARQAGVAPP